MLRRADVIGSGGGARRRRPAPPVRRSNLTGDPTVCCRVRRPSAPGCTATTHASRWDNHVAWPSRGSATGPRRLTDRIGEVRTLVRGAAPDEYLLVDDRVGEERVESISS
jgi:hypothetical protein